MLWLRRFLCGTIAKNILGDSHSCEKYNQTRKMAIEIEGMWSQSRGFKIPLFLPIWNPTVFLFIVQFSPYKKKSPHLQESFHMPPARIIDIPYVHRRFGKNSMSVFLKKYHFSILGMCTLKNGSHTQMIAPIKTESVKPYKRKINLCVCLILTRKRWRNSQNFFIFRV